jgi:TonB-dependent receptor
MIRKKKGAFLLLIVFFFSIQLIQAQQRIVSGKVTDSDGQALPGANVVIKNTSKGTITDHEGVYQIMISDASDTLHFSFIGYREFETRVNEASVINATMYPDAEELSEVVISTQARGQRAAINQQFASNRVMNVVSSEKMQELPDANAAESIGRLPGISLQRASGEASKVVIRGMSPKYSNVTLEGVKMASTGQDRSVDLSLIQGDALGGIEVSKSLQADQDADAIGGTVNLRLSEAPEKRKIDFMVQGGYANISRDFANYKFTGGFSDRFFNNKIGLSFRALHEKKQLASDIYNGGFNGTFTEIIRDDQNNPIDTVQRIRTTSYSLTEREQSRTRSNGTLILDYQSDWWEVKFFNLLSVNDDFTVNRAHTRVLNAERRDYHQSVGEWNSGNLSRTHTLQNKFIFGSSVIRLDGSSTYARVKSNGQNFSFFEETGLNIPEKSLIYADPLDVIEDYPEAGFGSLNVDNAYMNSMAWDESGLTDLSYDARIDYALSFSLFDNFSGKYHFGGKFHQLIRNSERDSRYSGLDYGGMDYRRQHLSSLYPDKITEFDNSGIVATPFLDTDYKSENFLRGLYELGWGADIDFLTEMQSAYRDNGGDQSRYYLDGVSSFNVDYEAMERKLAGYTMVELNYGNRLMILPGIRVEQNETEYSTYHIVTAYDPTGVEGEPEYVTTTRKNLHWFPSVNIKYKPLDIINIQGAAYKSTSRPSFDQISPLIIYSPGASSFISNNPWLEPSTAWNFDLGFAIKDNKFGLFTIYGFYKEIEDLIFGMSNYKPSKKGQIVGGPEDLDSRLLGMEHYDPNYVSEATFTNLPFNNPEKTYVKGIEFSWQTSLWYLTNAFKGLVLDINYTILDTKTSFPYFEQVIVGYDSSGFIPIPITGQEYKKTNGPMPDQPGNILNLILGYDYKGFSGRISYRYQGSVLQGIDGLFSLRDSYYDSFTLVDVMLKQQINSRLSGYVNLTNINNHVDYNYFGEQGPEQPELPTSRNYYGFRAQFGLRLKL